MKQEDQYAIKYLPIEDIEQTLKQPRETFEAEPLDELAKSIKDKGLLQPIIVRQNGTKYDVVVGGRRIKAAAIAGLREIPVIIADVSTSEAFELALIENVQREDLTFFEEANALLHLMRSGDFNNADDLAERIGKNRSFIVSRLKLLQLPESIQTMVAEKKLGISHAVALTKLPDKKRQEATAKIVAKDRLTLTETQSLVLKKTGSLVRRYKVAETNSPIAILERLHNYLTLVANLDWSQEGKITQKGLRENLERVARSLLNVAELLAKGSPAEETREFLQKTNKSVSAQLKILGLTNHCEQARWHLRRFDFSGVNLEDTQRIAEVLQALRQLIDLRLKNLPLRRVKEAKKSASKQRPSDKSFVSPDHVLRTICDQYGISLKRFLSPERTEDLITARQIAAYILREDLGLTFPNIAKKLNRATHLTVMYGHEVIQAAIKKNKDLRINLSSLREKIFGPAVQVKDG